MHEPQAVGVFPDEFVTPADHAIYCTDDLRRLRDAVQVREHRDLVRDGAVEPGPAHGAGTAHRVAQGIRGYLAIDVTGIHAVVPVGGLYHRHRWILGGRAGK